MSADDGSPHGSPAVRAARVRAFRADRSFTPGQRRLRQCRTGQRLAPRPRRVASYLAVVATPVGVMARRGAGSGGRPRRTHARGKVVGRTVFVTLAIISPAAIGVSLPRAYARKHASDCAVGYVRWADQEGRSMMGTVVFRGAPNQLQSASRSAVAAVSAGSPVVAAQAI